MECYPCLLVGIRQEAAGLCHHCSAALCVEHICEIEDPITISQVIVPALVLPKKARILLCTTCKEALAQVSSQQVEGAPV